MNAITQLPRPLSPDAMEVEVYDARDLVKNGTQTCILLDKQAYYLRITKAGKLILTK